MSRILRRSMFRGGPVDSRGTGITSGLMDTPKYATGGRVGYNQGNLVLGGDLYTQQDYSDFIKQYFPEGRKTEGFAPALLNQMFDSEGNLKEDYTYESIFSDAKGEKGKDAVSVYDTDLLSFADTGLIPGKKSKRITSKRPLANLLKEDVTETLKASEAYDTSSVPRGPAELGMTTRKPDEPPPPNTNNNNDTEPTEIDAKTLMRENAELFKELLGADNEKKLKDARIGDVSNYLLKFFEGSQEEGATVGSSAANVARFATATPSKTELAKQAIDKQDQTAIALAINDYIAGKRSKEQIDALTAKSDLALSNKLAVIQLAKEDLAANIIEAGKGGALGSQKLIQGIKSTPSLKGKGIEQFSSEKGESVEYESGYENKVFIDTDTETIFTFDPTGNKISLYQED